MRSRPVVSFRALGCLLLSTALAMAITAPVMASHGQPNQAVPFHAAILTSDPPDTSYGPPTCSGGTWDFTTSGWGQVTHLGQVSWEQSHCTHVDFVAQTGWTENGSARLTAANGDILMVAYDATFWFDLQYSYISVDWEVVGGTGRFADASGSGSGSALGDYAVAFETATTLVGSITYDASNRSG